MARKINGLHLWAVNLAVNLSVYSDALWITTATRSVGVAGRKAHSFLKKKGTGFRGAKVTSITWRGTLDA